MSAPANCNSKKLLKICPGCAMAHLARCDKVAEVSRAEVVPSDQPHCRLSCALNSCKQLCGVKGSLTLIHLLVLMYYVLTTAASAVVRLAAALLPVSQYLLLILVYGLECVFWVLAEELMYLKVLKGLASLAALVFLGYVAHLLVTSFVLPTLDLLYTLFRRGYYLT